MSKLSSLVSSFIKKIAAIPSALNQLIKDMNWIEMLVFKFMIFCSLFVAWGFGALHAFTPYVVDYNDVGLNFCIFYFAMSAFMYTFRMMDAHIIRAKVGY